MPAVRSLILTETAADIIYSGHGAQGMWQAVQHRERNDNAKVPFTLWD